MACVEIRNGYKYYGNLSNPKIVLNYLNMNVERGSIYGLLGASGCGKTTLLSCIVGQRKLISGEIRVLGLIPDSPGSGLPGPLVGYMPQEIALVEEMTIKESIYYFGRIYDLDEEKIQQRYNELKKLLELPPANRLVGQCSGGQKRRVSFACALVHEPELLILDEPTVGLDPMLREKIWDFLVETTRNSKMTVIITTHYIEEATKANRIGLMRNGILLAEDTPINIISNLESNSLEEAFLKLSQRQGSEDVIQRVTQGQSSDVSNVLSQDIIETVTPEQIQSETKNVNRQPRKSFTTTKRMNALLTKSVIQFIRQKLTMVFMMLLPIFVLTFYFWAIGITPKYLRIGIVNDEVSHYDKCFDKSLITIINHNNDTCELNKISCRYINELDSEYAEKVFYNSSEEAYKSAKKTDILGYIHFPHNFSESMQLLIEKGRFAEDRILQSAELTVRLDMTDQQASYFLRRRLVETYEKFMVNLMSNCNLSIGLGKSPINIEKVLYGSFNDEYQKFITPGIFITMIFFLTAITTSGVIISERHDGIWDRTLIAGISTLEILMAHLIFQSAIMAVQCIASIYYSIYVFGVENHGDNIWLILLLLLDGFCGMLFGLFLSIYCKSHMISMFMSTAVFYPLIILSGFLWPIEGQHKSLTEFVYIMPFTMPAISTRNILEKGWTILNSEVYNGFVILICWIIIFFVFSVIGLKRSL